ncbi:MAG: OB-fold nucleic acid binding domain-containing protein, partial [Candidatus Bathyarchaeia archaeon]
VYPIQRFVRPDETEGMLRRLIIADKTGEIKVVLWDDKANFPNIESSVDQIARFSHGYIRRGFDGKLELNIGSKGDISLSPYDVSEENYPPLTYYTQRIGEITGKEKSINVIGFVEEVYPVVTFKRQDGGEGKVRRFRLKDNSGRVTVVLWDRKVDELSKIENGKYIIIFEAKIHKRPDENFEIHIGNSTDIATINKCPSGFKFH